MATVNNSTTTNIYSSLGAKYKVGGLASGLNTEELVQALTMGTRSKIGKQVQAKQTAQWKTTAYRSTASLLRSFSDSRFSLTGKDNLISSSFFNSFNGTSSSSKITYKPTSTTSTGKVKVDSINSLATAQKISSKNPVTTELTGEAVTFNGSGNFTNKTLKVTRDGVLKTIKLDTLSGKNGDAAVQTELQSLLDVAFGKETVAAGGASVVTATITGGKVNLTSATGKLVVQGDDAKETLGLSNGMSNRFDTSKTIGELYPELVGNDFEFQINGQSFKFTKDTTLNKIMTDVTNSAAGVRLSFNNSTEKFVFEAKITGSGDNINMNDVKGNFLNAFIGAKGGNSFDSTVMYTGGISGGATTFTSAADLDGKFFNLTVGSTRTKISTELTQVEKDAITGSFTLEDAVAAKINGQITAAYGADSGVNVSFASGKMAITSSKSQSLSISQSNSATAEDAMPLLGFSGTTSNEKITMGYDKTIVGALNIAGESKPIVEVLRSLEGKTVTFNMTINGVEKKIALKIEEDKVDGAGNGKWGGFEKAEDYLAGALNKFATDAFGALPAGVNFKVEETTGKVTVGTGDGDNALVKLTDVTSPGTQVNFLTTLGITSGTTNKAAGQGSTVSQLTGVSDSGQFTINGTQFNYDSTTKIQDLLDEVNTAIGSDMLTMKSGKISINAGASPLSFNDDSGTFMNGLFGLSTYATNPGDDDKSKYDYGQNAEIKINGQILTSNTNEFKVDGIAFEVNELSTDAITVGSTSDPADVITKVKGFIEEYNIMIETLNKTINEAKVSGYDPLTDEQRAEMSESEITKWETQAKQGVLRNDSTIRTIINSFRAVLTTKVEAAGLSLYDIGITTAPLYGTGGGGINPNNNGKLTLDAAGEAKLKKALEENPDAVRLLFTHTSDIKDDPQGIAAQMKTVIDRATKISGTTDRGSLVQIAGTADAASNSSTVLGKKIDDIDKYVARLKTRLETEYNRHWAKFSALESAIQRMNSQSSWLTENA